MNHIPDIETQSIADQRKFQIEQLQILLEYLQHNSSFYQRVFNEEHININDIKHFEDLQSLPTTTKEDIQLYTDDFICVPRYDIREYATTSGTLGSPVSIALTDADLKRLAYNESRSFGSIGITKGNTIQLALTLDRQFMAGMAYYTGAKEVGATVIRTGSGLPGLQWDAIKRYQTDILVAVPSFILKMIDYARQNNIDLNNSGVKKVLAIGESLRNADLSDNILAEKLKEQWNIAYHNTYASTEMQTAFTECSYHKGGHHLPELVIAELIDENGIQVTEGETGELCITTLGITGMPLLRYRTGDICQACYEPCPCGRTTMRLSGVIGRKKQMIKFKGTSLYPNAVLDALNEVSLISEYVVSIYRNQFNHDELKIHLSLREQGSDDTTVKNIKEHLRSKLRIAPDIELCTDDAIRQMQFPAESRKQIKIIDRR